MKLEDFQKAFPGMYDDVSCGFDLCTGWESLVKKLSTVCLSILNNAKKEAISKYKKDAGLSYEATLDKDIIDKLTNFNIRVVQVKEKFGGLRFYTEDNLPEPEHNQLYGAISLAETLSYTVCLKCGLPGTLRDKGWWRTHCDECEKDYLTRV